MDYYKIFQLARTFTKSQELPFSEKAAIYLLQSDLHKYIHFRPMDSMIYHSFFDSRMPHNLMALHLY